MMRFLKRQLEFSFNVVPATTTWTTIARASKHLFEDVEASCAASAEASEIKVVEIKSTRASARRSFSTFPSRRRRRRCGSGFNRTPVLAVLIVEFSILQI